MKYVLCRQMLINSVSVYFVALLLAETISDIIAALFMKQDLHVWGGW